jgi:DNA modification methylase
MVRNYKRIRRSDKMTKEYTILKGDCLDRLKELPDNSVDSVVTDPPYGLSKEPDIVEVLTKWINGEPYDHGHGGFMGKTWDSFVPHPDIWREVYRVLKPGGHALVFAGTRTQDLMTTALRLAGFEVRDVIEWLYFSGFPKSMDVSKAFDKREGIWRGRAGKAVSSNGSMSSPNYERTPKGEAATELAKKWDGWGTALKPAHEPIIVVRKPLIDADTGRKMTVVDCVEKYGTGAINIDASRIGDGEDRASGGKSLEGSIWGTEGAPSREQRPTGGRFPANAITTDADAFFSKYFNVAQTNISPAELSKKASKRDRNSGWQGDELALRNTHPTVKPTELMAWLVRLVTPPGGIVLDPFAGSGSTLVAAKREGFGFIGIEREPEYVEIIEARTGEVAQ